ncbi:hypothetical protein IB238_01970 [Rhizobium sp. ARZ01]|uniref:hypothetical protein n=1 Tax=Rhizobium sp. ARZ01 TaxID=2769313 RepID=UPI00177B8BB3|nr:hypothetical protein [Rhizobium sp. ARZ01]MBD9371405.1 hypothetical protein [Rhizobium sp. ARZ01]
MNKNITKSWTGLRAALVGLLLTSAASAARADSCPSIDSWLELIRERGGQHRLLNASELARSINMFKGLADLRRRSWTSGIMTVFPNGSGLLLLNVDTSVCGIIELPPNRRPTVQMPIALRSR